MRTFRKEIMWFTVKTIAIISSIVILISLVAAGKAIITKTEELAMKQEESLEGTLTQRFETFYQIARLLRDNELIVTDLGRKAEDTEEYNLFSLQVYQEMLEMKSMYEDIDYVAVLNYEDESVKYLGKVWVKDNKKIYDELKEKSRHARNCKYPTMKTEVSSSVFPSSQYSWNLYLPVYDPIKVTEEIGMIVIGVDENTLLGYFESQSFQDAYITDSDGLVLSCKNKSEIGKTITWNEKLRGNNGIKRKNGNFIIYDKLKECNWYIVAIIPILALLKDSIRTLGVLFVLTAFVSVLAGIVSNRFIKKLYHPIEDIQNRMHMVANGNMDIRMDVIYEEQEFNEMAISFNKMVKAVEHLMETIREEQNQMKQIELNALQSQIKPHFLYNTLECIHWQALVEGDKKVSKLVKALAVYYRLCLGKGKDIVPLKQELEHIDNYVIIQNMRYGDIIDFKYDVEEKYLELPIPKMTLQPLIENSIYHGIRVKEGKTGEVRITVSENSQGIVVSVEDSGEGMTQEKVDELNASLLDTNEKIGYGVHNVNKRIEILFGKEYGLNYKISENGRFSVDILLPKNWGEQNA